MKSLLLKFFCVVSWNFGYSIHISQIDVPEYQLSTEDVQLNCTYELEHANPLYSIKWYRNSHNFYKFEPRSMKPKAFEFPGIHVDLNRSKGSTVLLTHLSSESSGQFKCEVMTDKPTFETDMAMHNMTVVDPAPWGPDIEGIKDNEQVKIGNNITARCLVGISNPAANLTWLINGNSIDPNTKISKIRTVNDYGRSEVESQMTLPLRQEYFIKYETRIECSARIYNVFHKIQSVVLIDKDRPEPRGFAWFFSSGSNDVSPIFVRIVFISFCLLF